MQRRYRQRVGEHTRAVPDSDRRARLLRCSGLITRDQSYRDYFKGLKLIVPG